MKVITAKLRRVKIMIWTISIMLSPARLLLIGLYYIGEFSETILNTIDRACLKIMNGIIKRFDLDRIAREQYESGKYKDKFKNLQ